MKPTDLAINQVVILQPDLPDSPSFRAVILGLEPAALRLELAQPEAQALIEMLPPGAPLKLQVWDGDILLTGASSLLEVRPDGAPPRLTVGRPLSLQQPHRRNFFRVEVSVPCTVRVVRSKGASVPLDAPRDAETLDLSGGGIRAIVHLALERGDLVEVVLALPTAKVKANARVAWARECPGAQKDKPLCSAGLEFAGLSRVEQDRIVAFVFKCQRANRLA